MFAPKNAGDRLREAREEKGLTLAQAVGLTGYSKSTLVRYEMHGPGNPVTLHNICLAYGIHPLMIWSAAYPDAEAVLLGNLPPECKEIFWNLAQAIAECNEKDE